MAGDNRRTFTFNPGALSAVSSRSKNISQVITDALIAGYWLPGERINDLELANLLHVSRISVREALTSLVERKVVEKVHWKGYFVRKLTLEEVQSIIEVRTTLEELAVTKLLANKNQDIFGEMRESIERSARELKANNYPQYMSTDFEFHELIYKGSGNLWIKVIIDDLRLQISLLRNLSMVEDFRRAGQDSIRDHRLIFEKLEAGDKRGAIVLLHKHFDTQYRNIEETYGQLDKMIRTGVEDRSFELPGQSR
jgi:DNA-binding GntR family transcriptional regulator